MEGGDDGEDVGAGDDGDVERRHEAGFAMAQEAEREAAKIAVIEDHMRFVVAPA
jgi:hypothetical protein